MGIEGLKRYLSNERILKRVDLLSELPPQECVLVVDGSCLSRLLHNTQYQIPGVDCLHLAYGAQWSPVAANVHYLVERLRECNFRLVVVFDGLDEEDRMDLRLKRRESSAHSAWEACEIAKAGELPTEYSVPPSGWRVVVQDMLRREEGVTVIQAAFEADRAIVHYCRDHPDVWGVLANDYDFCVVPYVPRLLDTETLFLFNMSIHMVEKKDLLDGLSLPEPFLAVLGSLLSSDYADVIDRKKVEGLVRGSGGGVFETSSERVGAVLKWVRGLVGDSVEDVVGKLEKEIVGFKKVWLKFTDFESPEIAINDAIMERFRGCGIKIPSQMEADYLDGKLSPTDISLFLHDNYIPKGMEDEDAFAVRQIDLMSMAQRIRAGIILPQMNWKDVKQLDTANEMAGAIQEVLKRVPDTDSKLSWWSHLRTAVEQSFMVAQNIISEMENPIFIITAFDMESMKQYPVRIIYDHKYLDYTLKIEKENEIKVFAGCSLAGSPKYISTEKEQTVDIDLIQQDFPQIAHLRSLDDAVFILSVAHLLNNGLNGRIYERELNGLIQQHLAIKRGEVYSNPPFSMRNSTLCTYYQSVYSHHLSLLRYLHIPNQLYLNLHGQVFHHFLSLEVLANYQDTQFMELKKLILSFLVVPFQPQPEKRNTAPVIICRFWNTPGGCRNGTTCTFAHINPNSF